jgi:hypothetical protein
MASSPATIAQVEQARPAVAACPKCNVVFAPVHVKESESAAAVIGGLLIFLGIIGGLLIFLGIIGLIGTLVGGAATFGGGLVLIGLGILVTSVDGRQSGLMCSDCGASRVVQLSPAQPEVLSGSRSVSP